MRRRVLKHLGTARARLVAGLGLGLALLLVGVSVLTFGQVRAASPALNNKGISTDGVATSTSFDGVRYSYSASALQAAGFASGAIVTVNNLSFQWPMVAPSSPDNWQAAGQVIPVSAAGATEVGFLGAATLGPSSGTGTLTYTDNSTQAFTLAFSDWTLNGGTASVLPADTIAATLSYRNTSSGAQQTKTTYVFFTSVPLAPGKTLQSVTLPTGANQGALHVFALGTGLISVSAALNNEGIKADGTASSTSFDGVGYSYSANALQAAGFGSGAAVTVNGVSFQWPTVAANTPDNWQTIGQTIAVNAPGATIVGFLGAASRGPSSGTGTLTYTDNSTQSFTLAFSDWTLNGGTASVLPADGVAATLSYRDNSSGAKQTKTTYVFFTSVALQPGKTLQSVTLPNGATQGALHVFAIGTTAGPQGSATWETYLGSPAHTSYNAAETAITPQTAAKLKKVWSVHTASITGQPIVGNNLIYWGSWDGYEHAANLAGTEVWRRNLGTTVGACFIKTGVVGAGTLGTINGTPALFVAGGNATFYALNALTGAVIWQRQLGSPPAHFLWSSPMVANGSVYVGMASLLDCPLVQGQLIQLNADTGAVQHTLNLVPNGCIGGSVWDSPSLDAASGLIYFATGNPGTCSQAEPLTYAVVAVHASDLSIAGSWRVPTSQQLSDVDFGATVTLFTATINGTPTPLLGVANKNGWYYAFDRSKPLSAGPLWEDKIAIGGDDPGNGFGSISSSAWDGTTLYVGGGKTTINGVSCAGGTVRAVNPATGAYLWQHCLGSGYVIAAITAIPGAIVVGAGSTFYVLASSNGATLFRFQDTTTHAVFNGPATVVNGRLYEGNVDGNFYAFGL
jgi:hypothetical protein